MSFFKNLLNALLKGSTPYSTNLGVVQHESDNDITNFDEIVAKANPVIFNQIDTTKLPDYPVRTQNGSSGCVAFSLNLIGSIMYYQRTGTWVDFSPAYTYSQRSNKPGEGMILGDVFSLAASKGFLPDVLMPSDNLSEDQMNNPSSQPWFDAVAAQFALNNSVPIRIPAKDIDTLISTMQTTNKPVMLWFTFGSGEWGEIPSLTAPTQPYVHSVVAIPPKKLGEVTSGIFNGEKAVIIQDSWGKPVDSLNGKRIITKSFYEARNFLAAYPMKFKFDAVAGKPVFTGSIASMQDCLKYEGFFPTNVSSSGVFGSITIGALKKFQAKYGIDQTGSLGPITTTKLQQVFS